MVKKEPVNLLHQMILSVIPGANLYAFYRIQKLRMLLLTYLVISIGATLGFGLIIVISFTALGEDIVEMLQFLKGTPMRVILFAIGSLINIYLVRRWSKKWNEQLQNPKNNDSPTFTKFF